MNFEYELPLTRPEVKIVAFCVQYLLETVRSSLKEPSTPEKLLAQLYAEIDKSDEYKVDSPLDSYIKLDVDMHEYLSNALHLAMIEVTQAKMYGGPADKQLGPDLNLSHFAPSVPAMREILRRSNIHYQLASLANSVDKLRNE